METPKYFTKNRLGITVCKCCASCEHKRIDNRTRLCMAGGGSVYASYLCKDWAMSETLENAGRGTGRVKKLEYLTYVLDTLESDNTAALAAAERREHYTRTTIQQIRSDFEERHGSIYAISER